MPPGQGRDPRSHRRYIETRAAWLPTQVGRPCSLGNHPIQPGQATVEHTLPIRRIVEMASSWTEAVALACDTSLWDVACRRCQSRQGALVSNRTRHGYGERKPSRAW